MKRAILLLVLLFLAPLAAADGPPLVVGVLEHPQCQQGDAASARLMFVKEGARWVKIEDGTHVVAAAELARVSWTVAFDGRSLGGITLQPPGPTPATGGLAARDRLYPPQNPEALPAVKNVDQRFGGWCHPPAQRPLVLLSQPHYDDPEVWTPLAPSPSYRQTLHGPMKLRVGRTGALRCLPGGGEVVPWDFTPNDLVLYRSYRSSSGRELVSIGMDKRKIGCDLLAEPEWGRQVFLIEGGRVDFIGAELELVDAGDFDHDGRSEMLFWYSGYNRDGYVLFYDDLRRRVEYLWSYH